MASPLTTERLVAPSGAAITAIAGAPGAWCPALSPDGARVAYVTDRSGIPRLEVATLDQRTLPAVLAGPDQEVVSVAWSHLLLPGEGHTIVGREHLVELGTRVAAWFDRWL